MGPRDRFVSWFQASGKSKREVGRLLRCSDVYVGYLLSGERSRPGLDIAFRIEAATADWEHGPILAQEWVAPVEGEATFAATGSD